MSQDFVSPPPTRGTVDEFADGQPVRVTRGWTTFFARVFDVCFALTQAGTTAQRPTVGLWVGRRYWDSTLGMPIYWNGTAWKRADGTNA